MWRWSEQDGYSVVPDVCLSLDRPPPAQNVEPIPSAKPPRTKPQPGDGVLTTIEMCNRFKTWLNTPDPPKQPTQPPHAAEKKQETAPPFDIQEIPNAMRKNFMSKSAALMERWFAGKLNYSLTEDDEKAEINQDGHPYPPDMYDTTTIKLDWVLQFLRAKTQYETLINTVIYSPDSIRQLHKTLLRYRRPHVDLDTWTLGGRSLAGLHRHFQFEYVGVEKSLGQKFAQFLDTRLRNEGAPDDLTGSLGSFNIYAAIAYAHFNGNATTADVSGIYVYIKDNYTFTDKPGTLSQYLGHWNGKGVVIVPYDAGASAMNQPWLPYVNHAIAVGDARDKGNIYYPIHNSSFRAWAKKHRRGGDFVVYSDYRFVPIYPPIKVWL